VIQASIVRSLTPFGMTGVDAYIRAAISYAGCILDCGRILPGLFDQIGKLLEEI
jgi:hypothetical protein